MEIHKGKFKVSEERKDLRWHWIGETLALLIAAISAGFGFYWMFNPDNALVEPLLSVLGATTVFVGAAVSGIAIEIDRRKRQRELKALAKAINKHTSREQQKTRKQGQEQFESLSATADRTQSGIEELQVGVGQVGEDVRNLPQRIKEQELIERLIAAADNFEHRFRHTYAEDQLGALQGARIDFDKLRALAKFLLQDDFSEIYDVFHSCCMELAFAIKGLAKSPIPPASEEKWNSVCCGPRRKELDAEVKGAYENLQKKLHRDNV